MTNIEKCAMLSSAEYKVIEQLMMMFRKGEISRMDTNEDVYERLMKKLNK